MNSLKSQRSERSHLLNIFGDERVFSEVYGLLTAYYNVIRRAQGKGGYSLLGEKH